MLFSKTLLVLLVAILGTSWIPDGRTNGLVFACWSKVEPLNRCEQKNDPTEVSKEITKGGTIKVPTIEDIPQEDEEFATLSAGIWVADKYYRLPNAPNYKVVFKMGTSSSSTPITNKYYRGNNNNKD